MLKKRRNTLDFIIFQQKYRFILWFFFGTECIPQEQLNKIRDKSITHNIFRLQDNDFIVSGFYSNAFIKYILPGKTLLYYTN